MASKLIDYDALFELALQDAFRSLNIDKNSGKSRIFRFKRKNHIAPTENISKEYVLACPITRRYSLPELNIEQAEEDEAQNNQQQQQQRQQMKRRRKGVSERSEEDRNILRHVLKNYSLMEHAISYNLW